MILVGLENCINDQPAVDIESVLSQRKKLNDLCIKQLNSDTFSFTMKILSKQMLDTNRLLKNMAMEKKSTKPSNTKR